MATLRAALYELFLGEGDLEALKAAGADYDLAPPGPAELAEIVRKPAEAAGLVYETSAAGERLDDRLLRDAAGVDTLPPLQFTLQRLFAERQIVGPERRLAFAAYGAVGGVGGAIDLAAERALAGLGEAEVGALPRLLRQLAIPMHQAAPNDAGRPLLTIRAATLLEAATDAAACRLVDALVEARILLHAKERGVSTIRIAHDRVLESWQRARAIVAGDLPRVGDEARGPAAASGTSKRQWLPTAAAVALAVVAAIASWQYFEARAAKRTAEQAEMAALAERDRAARERQLAEDERKQSEEQRDIAQKRQEKAEEQRQLAQDRQKEAEEQRGIAHQLKEAAEAHRLLAEVRRKEAEMQRNRALTARSRFLADLADQKLKSSDDVTAILLALEALSDENSGIVRPLEPQRVLDKAWRFEGDERIPREAQVLIGHAGSIRVCALSRDGLRAVTGSADKTARVWDTQTGATVAQLNGHSADISYVAFTADGGKILTAAEDGVRRWDATTGASSAVVPEARSLVAMSDNGQQVISSSAPNRVHLWDANTGQELTRTMGGAILDTRLRSGRRTRARRRRRHFHRALRAGKRQPPPRVPGACQQGAQRCNQSRRAADRVGRRRSDGAHLERTERHAADRARGCQIQA